MLDPCTGQNRDGSPCSAKAQPGRQWCVWHDPDLDRERATWRRKGGESKSNVVRAGKRLPRQLKDVEAILLRSLAAVEAGELSPAQGTALANISRAIISLHTAGTLEERLVALEARAGIRSA